MPYLTFACRKALTRAVFKFVSVAFQKRANKGLFIPVGFGPRSTTYAAQRSNKLKLTGVFQLFAWTGCGCRSSVRIFLSLVPLCYSRFPLGLLNSPPFTVPPIVSYSTRNGMSSQELLEEEKTQPAKGVTKSRKMDRHLRIVWVDLEMTGLDIEKDTIIEMACIITDQDLNVVAEGPDLIIHQDDEVMDNMNDWCKKHHGESGLTDAVKQSNTTLEDAEQIMLKFIKQHVPKRLCPLAGNSVHQDKKFLDKYMPSFSNYLHYRIIDVSSVKEIARRWYSKDLDLSWKKGRHRARDDILESIRELKQYRTAIFK